MCVYTIISQLRELVISVIIHPISVHMYLEMYSVLAMVAGGISSTCKRNLSMIIRSNSLLSGSFISCGSLLFKHARLNYSLRIKFSVTAIVI